MALACGGNGDGAPSVVDTPAGETPTDGAGGEGGELTLEEYFQRIEELGDDLNAGQDELLAEFGIASTVAETDEEVVEAFKEIIASLIPLSRGYVEDLERIDPPSEVEEAHNEAVALQVEALETIEDLNERVQRVESAAEVEELGPIDSAEFLDRRDQNCFALEAIAEENGIFVDLGCGPS